MSIPATPTKDDGPISCHKKYVTTLVPSGPIHKNWTNLIAISNLFTSFDNKFTTWPTVVSPREVLLNLKAWIKI